MTIDVITRDVIGYEELYTVDIFGNVVNKKTNKEVKWNLEWSTPKENIKHALSTGLRKNVKVKVVETGKIYTNAYECAKDIDGNAADIYRCLRGKTKTHKKLHFEEVK